MADESGASNESATQPAPPRKHAVQTAPDAGSGPTPDIGLDTEFHRGLGLFDATMVVVGSMIGSGIFIVSADMARLLGSPGWLLVAWLITGILTVAGALAYGELAAMMPRAGGMYVYLREAFSPVFGFLYGWTLLLVIQTGTVAAVAVGFARFAGVFWPQISEERYLIEPIRVGNYALSLSTAQLVGVLMIALLTWTNMRGLQYGKWVQNLFTVAKTGALFGLIVLALALGWNAAVVHDNADHLWTIRATTAVEPGLTAATMFGLFIALCVSQTGSLFAADSWHSITFTAGEVQHPRRNLPLALLFGAGGVIVLYVLANVAYLVTLPLHDPNPAAMTIQNPPYPADRVGTATLTRIFPAIAVPLMAGAIMISTFGCNNGLILSGARVYYAMARDRLFFRPAGTLNEARVPAWGLLLQGVWAAFLVLPRTVKADGTYGNLYSDLLDYIMSAALLFYALTILGLFRLRVTQPNADRPYKAFGYPVVPALYVVGASVLVIVLLVYRTQTTWPGFFIVLLGVPVYYLWTRRR
jgi:APA family basic amino acid/polyamine antiporter